MENEKNITNEPIEEGTSEQTQNELVEENEQQDENLSENKEQDEPEVEEEEQKPEPETVPLKTYLETKRKLRDMKRKFEKLEDEKKAVTIRNKKNEIKDRWIKRGFDEETAAMHAEDIAAVYEEMANAKAAKQQSYIDEEIEELANEDIYSDIKDYSKQIKAKINKFEQAGVDLTVEEAYLHVIGPQNIIKENRLKTQQTNIVNNKNQGARKNNVQTAASNSTKNPYKLDKDDLKALTGLKKMQPEAKWTQKKYYEMMKK